MTSKAYFAGGCFWCLQPPFDALPGVSATTVGYMGGRTKDPTYEEVCAGGTGHAEAIEVIFDPAKASYDELLDVFWRQIDPTAAGRQFADVGSQYRSAVFHVDEAQRRAAEASKAALASSGRFDAPIVTEIAPAGPFYPAEEHHQKYYLKRTFHYKLYRKGSGREDYLRRTWPDSQTEQG